MQAMDGEKPLDDMDMRNILDKVQRIHVEVDPEADDENMYDFSITQNLRLTMVENGLMFHGNVRNGMLERFKHRFAGRLRTRREDRHDGVRIHFEYTFKIKKEKRDAIWLITRIIWLCKLNHREHMLVAKRN